MKRLSVHFIGSQPRGAHLNGFMHVRVVAARRREDRLWTLKKEAETFWRTVMESETLSRLGFSAPSGPKTALARGRYDQIAAQWYANALALEQLVESLGFTQFTYDKHVVKCRAQGSPVTCLPRA